MPFRNTIFLSYALAISEGSLTKGITKCDIFTGFKNEGKENYPDTTPEYLKKILRDLYGSSYSTITDSIKSKLEEFNHKESIAQFINVMVT